MIGVCLCFTYGTKFWALLNATVRLSVCCAFTTVFDFVEKISGKYLMVVVISNPITNVPCIDRKGLAAKNRYTEYGKSIMGQELLYLKFCLL